MITDTPERKILRSRLGKLIARRGNYDIKIALLSKEIDELKAKLAATKVRRGTLEAAE